MFSIEEIFVFLRPNMNHLINILYIIGWGIVSMVSSFMKVLDEGRAYFEKANFHDEFLNPLLIWLIAFLVDLAFSVASRNRKGQQYNTICTSMSYLTIIYVVSWIFASKYFNCPFFNYLSVIGFLIGMLALKAESLYIIENVNELEQV